jgi:hypothetical protein
LSTGVDIRGGDDNNGDMEIEDVVKRIDALVECNSLKVEGNKNFVEFLFGGQSTGIGVNRVRGGWAPYRMVPRPDGDNNDQDVENICPACSLEEACCRAYAEILLEELENRGDEIVLKYEG